MLSMQTKLLGAAGLAEKIRLSLSQVDWPNNLELSCSAGVAEMVEHEAFASLVARADAALYQTKSAGRNRVELAEPLSVARCI